MIYVNAHTHIADASDIQILSYTDVANFSSQQAQKYFSLGIHPWFVDQYKFETLKLKLITFKDNPNFAGLGEIGLDRSKDNFELQLKLFEQQLQLGMELGINRLILHCVKAQSDILALLKQHKFKGMVLWHGFNGGESQIHQILQAKFTSYFGIGHLIFSNAKISKNINAIPENALLFETDDNQEYKIQDIYCEASKLMHKKLEDLTSQVLKNFKNFVNFSD